MTYRYWQRARMSDGHASQVPEFLQKIGDLALAHDYDVREAVISRDNTKGRLDIAWDADGDTRRALVLLAPGNEDDSLNTAVLTAMSDEWNSREPSLPHMLGMVSSATPWPFCVAPFWQNIIDVAAVPDDSKIDAIEVLTEDIVFPHRDYHMILAGTEVERLFLWSWPGIVEVVVLDDVQRKALEAMNLPAVPSIPPGQVRVLPAPGSAVPTAAFDITDSSFTACVRALMTEHADRPLPLEWNDFPVFTKWWHTA